MQKSKNEFADKTKKTKAKTTKQKTTKRKTSARKSRKKNGKDKNLLSILIGLVSVCIIMLTVFLFINPAVKKEKQRGLTKQEIQKENKAEENQAIQEKIKIKEKESQKSEKEKNELELNTEKDAKRKAEIDAEKSQEKKAKDEARRKAEQKAKQEIEKQTKQKKLAELEAKRKAEEENKRRAEQEAKLKAEQKRKAEQERQAKLKAVELAKAPPIKELPQLPSKGTLIFVFDDAGHNLAQLEYFLNLPFPCAIAVLPKLPHSKEAANRIRKAGKEVMLHQPMQAMNLNIDPGDGAIKPGMSADAIRQTLVSNIEEISPIAGMNNHEGSLITSDEFSMKIVLQVCREKNIFFLDSRTSSKTVVPKVAAEMNFPIWERAIFLDNDKTAAAMEKQIIKGLDIAEKKGSAIMIGHVFTIELAKLLEKMYPSLKGNGFSFATISTLGNK